MKLFRKTSVWMPTRRGFFLLLILITLLGWIGFGQLYPFLACNRPLEQPPLVIIEGWLGDAELASVVKQADTAVRYVTTGGPVTFAHSLLAEKTYAEVTAARLRKLGVDPSSIFVASSEYVVRDRTYASALAVRRELETRGLFGSSANIYSLGAHSRRSFFLYRRVFGSTVPLGVISLESSEFDLRHWWRGSLSFKHVMGEWTSWLYTQCTFWRY